MSNGQKRRVKVSKYRFETGTLFEYNEEQDAYVACFTDYRADTKAKAIKAYEENEDEL